MGEENLGQWAIGLMPPNGVPTAIGLYTTIRNAVRQIHPGIFDAVHGDWGAFWDAMDVFVPIREWPRHFRQMMYGRHLNNEERFTLFLFLTGNGLEPSIAAGFVLIPAGDYDMEAMRQMVWLMHAAYNGELFDRYRTYDINYRQIRPPPLRIRNRR